MRASPTAWQLNSTRNNNGHTGGPGDPGSLGYFDAEPDSSNHVALDLDGVLTNTAATNVYGNGSCGFAGGIPAQDPNSANGCMSNGHVWTVNISYDGAELDVIMKDEAEGLAFKALTDYAIDIGSYLGTDQAYVGFTGSTGSGQENHDILNWKFANTTEFAAVPLPASVVLFGSGLIGLAGLMRLRRR
jgi:hypothetical protein